MRLAWLTAAPDGIALVGADGDRLVAPAESLRDTGDRLLDGEFVRFRAPDGEHALHAAPGEPLARSLWGLLRGRMFRAPTDQPLGRLWRRLAGGFTRIRVENEDGVAWEGGPVRTAECSGGLCVLSPVAMPVQVGDTARVQLIQGRRRFRFVAQVTGPVTVDALPVGLRRFAEGAPDGSSSFVLRPLQSAPEELGQNRALFRLSVEQRSIPLELCLDGGGTWTGSLTDVGGLGVGVRGGGPIPDEPGALGLLLGLEAVLGAEFARARVRLVHRRFSVRQGALAGLRLEDLTPAQVDRLHARVIELERSAR